MLTSFVIPIVAILVIPVIVVWMLVKRGTEIKALIERGRPVTGRVIDKRARHSKGSAGRHRRVKLSYERPDTGPRERWIVVTRQEWDTYAEGAAVDLVYLPDRPSVFATRALVNHARTAKGLPPLTASH